ncbi:sigma-54 interaction domain-containing protein [Mucilaginibacter aquaedulcis]|uniref:sigma-54 interaction domain-containing protein n=1 Tax=Mucilaginibacter aquaedulcis TaxID=1187081 RepID=UPI0025B3966C|nr:sigma 54-interacting transcriptional regulator [Mucilaginibacter aquaedulcis]MDN3548874.1 sigma 54-interacting transcriptional regulator [Mucilaginibacter aquaedulcis]
MSLSDRSNREINDPDRLSFRNGISLKIEGMASSFDFISAISAVRHKADLLQLISSGLKRLISFFDYSIFFSNEDKPDLINYCGLDAYHDLKIWLTEQLLDSRVISFAVSDMTADSEIAEQLIQQGITHMAGAMMDKESSGYLLLFSKEQEGFTVSELEILSLVTKPLAHAVFNMLRVEQMHLQAAENAELFEFIKEIGMVRDRDTLLAALDNTQCELFRTAEYILTIKDAGQSYRWFYLHKFLSPLVQGERVPEITTSSFCFSEDLATTVLNSNGPVYIDLETGAHQDRVGTSAAVFFKSMGISSLIGMPLKQSDEQVGILWLVKGEKDYGRILTGIAPYLAAAIRNITNNEQVQVQLKELFQYREQLEIENLYLQEEIEITNNYNEIVGASRVMGNLFHMVSQVAGTSSSVLIQGETGTGKELIARAIHNTSPRRDKMMVKINCAALPPNLIESELFGHERGSFTGATERRIGKFELANNSTLFLDEIGELPIDLQVKLLRALQEKEIERVGGKTVIKTNVRIIAATNRDLKQEVKLGNFRNDLYFRLNVFPVFIPPLRERKEDINLLATHFLNKHAKKSGKKVIGFSSKVMKQLHAYDWPGNVRELEHLIERSILLATQPVINAINLPTSENKESNPHLAINRIKTIDEIEREHILYVLRSCKGKVSGIGGAAQALNIPSTTLGSKMKRLGITKEFTSE